MYDKDQVFKSDEESGEMKGNKRRKIERGGAWGIGLQFVLFKNMRKREEKERGRKIMKKTHK